MTARQVKLALWPYIGAVLFLILLWDGAAYLLDPPAVPPARPGVMPNDPWFVLRIVPGGLRTHGLVLLGFATVLLVILASRRTGTPHRIALVLLAFYAAFATYCMVGAWWEMPDPIWTSPSKWFAIAALTIGLILAPRPPGRAERA